MHPVDPEDAANDPERQIEQLVEDDEDVNDPEGQL